ncbi:amidohydrolase family protein [Paenibacillus qinlingensis]|nr:amidohydrolase family protein [Paenibacillus qinlingensis]
MVYRQVRVLGNHEFQGPIDIGVLNGKIVAMGEVADHGEREVDGTGHLLLPPFVESHIHLDTVLTAGEPDWNESGTLFEGIGIWQKRKGTLTYEDVMARAEKVLRMQISTGVLHVRSMVDISDPNLTALRALLALRERVKPYLTLQVIAFPQDGIRACPDNEQRLELALELGADGISAVPHLEATRSEGEASLEICFRIAEKYGCFVHVFCDEMDDPHSTFLENVAHLAIRSDLGSRVTAAHVNATAYYSEAYFQKVLGIVARSGIHIVCCPLINSAMQGRFDSSPKGRGIARIKEMWLAGINVSIAHDDIRTPFYPLGTGNMLQAAHMAAHLAHMTGREEIAELVRMITIRAAQTLQLSEYGIAVGLPASFIMLRADNEIDLVRGQPLCRHVVSRGQLLTEALPAQTFWFTDY